VTPPPQSARRARLAVTELEPRDVPSAVPTLAEQVFLERLNDARANPAAYGRSIGVDLSYIFPSSPLAFDTRLIGAARAHSQDMNARGFVGSTGSNGRTPAQRITAAGYPWVGWAETVTAGYTTPEAALRALITDANSPTKANRHALLGHGTAFRLNRDVGVGIVQNGSGPQRHYYTVDMAYTADTRAYLTGVVYRDLNGNGKYDPGEGVGGATVSVNGGPSTTTWSTGGYSLRVNPGTYIVTATGGGLPGTIARLVGVARDNQRFDFVATVSTPVSPPPAAPPSPAVNRPPVLSPIADRTTRMNTAVTIALSASDPDGNPLTYSATVQSQAFTLDQQYGFYAAGGLFTNYWGRGEKWFKGNGGWYFIEPDGEVWRVGTTAGSTSLVGRLEVAYFHDPSKLWNATRGGRVSISGNNLTVTPEAGFVGRLTVTATVSDGRGGSASRTFIVTVA
jgi:uncharacterized protein YkwD